MTSELRLTKCKQHGKSFLSFRIGSSNTEFHAFKFLLIQLKAKNADIYLSNSQPNEAWTENAPSAAIIRKYLDGANLLSYQFNQSTHLLIIKNQESHWLLEIDCQESPTLSLIDEKGKNYFRWSANGTFTKAKMIENFSFPKIQDNLIQSLLKPNENPSIAKTETKTFSDLQRTIRDRLARQVKTLKRATEKQKQNKDNSSNPELYKKQAQFLQDHLHLVKEGDLELRFDNQVIELDPDLSVGENVNRLFIKAKKSERGLREGSTRLANVAQELKKTEEILLDLRSREFSIEELNQITRQFKIDTEKKTTTPIHNKNTEVTYREFKASDGSSMLLGRSAKENDLLTKRARSDDYWFHAVNASGSHVIVPKKKLANRQELSSQTIREACILALHFSKLATAQSGEVYVTTRGNLRKQKGMADGLWQVLKCETLNIKYEKPELDAIFAR